MEITRELRDSVSFRIVRFLGTWSRRSRGGWIFALTSASGALGWTITGAVGA
jgi:hypothetical protein